MLAILSCLQVLLLRCRNFSINNCLSFYALLSNFLRYAQVINKLGSAEEIAKSKAPVDVSSAKEAVVHNAAVDLKILF